MRDAASSIRCQRVIACTIGFPGSSAGKSGRIRKTGAVGGRGADALGKFPVANKTVEILHFGIGQRAAVKPHVIHVDVRAAVPWVVADVERAVVTGGVPGKRELGVEDSVDITPPLVASFHAGDMRPGARR